MSLGLVLLISMSIPLLQPGQEQRERRETRSPTLGVPEHCHLLLGGCRGFIFPTLQHIQSLLCDD